MIQDFYGRKSIKDGDRSISSQEKDWLADCAEQGNEVGRAFRDPDRSASRYAKRTRPDYAELLKHLRSGNCELLTLWESSRGSRSLGEWADFLDLCRKQGILIRVLSHGRTYDVRVRRDWRTLADDGVDADDESQKISERVTRGKRDAAADGKPVGRRGYGWVRVYDRSGRVATQVPDPVTGPIVEEIIKRIAAGGEKNTNVAIAKDLNRRGIPTAEGKTWTDRQVRQLALKPVHAGYRVHRGEIVGKGTWEPLVDPAIWERARTRLMSQARTGSTYVSHWLTGAIRCGRCTHVKSMLRSAPRYEGSLKFEAYGCRTCHKVSASSRGLEAVIEPMIVGRMRRDDIAALFVPGTTDADLREAVDELQVLRDRLDEHYAEASKGNLSAAGLAAVERLLLADIKRADAKVRKLALPSALEGLDVNADWSTFEPRRRRDITVALAEIVLAPGTRVGGPRFDLWRLAESRWVGQEQTWGEIWEADGIPR